MSLPKADKTDEELVKSTEENRSTFFQRVFSWRNLIVLILHSVLVCNTAPMFILPMAFVCMVKPTHRSAASTSVTELPVNVTKSHLGYGIETSAHLMSFNMFERNLTSGLNYTEYSQDRSYEFNWDSQIVGLILAAPSFTGIFGAMISDLARGYLGNKWTWTLISLYTALLLFVSPIAARTNVYALLAVRILQGLTAGGSAPITTDTIAWWLPKNEVLSAVSITRTGYQTAMIFAFAISGFLCGVPVDNGWPFMFYMAGVFVVLLTLLWHFVYTQKPEEHPFISEREKHYIINTRGAKPGKKKREDPPYKSIALSIPFYGWLVPSVLHLLVAITNANYLPIYLSAVLKFNSELTGTLATLIFLCSVPGVFFWTSLNKVLRANTKITSNKARKILFMSGSGLAAACQVSIAFIGADLIGLAVTLWCLGLICTSVSSSVLPTVSLDMAPKFAGTLIGLTFTVGGLIVFIGPLMAGALTPTNSPEEWRNLLLIIGAIQLFGGIFFTLFGQASLQPWAQGQEKDEMVQSQAFESEKSLTARDKKNRRDEKEDV